MALPSLSHVVLAKFIACAFLSSPSADECCDALCALQGGYFVWVKRRGRDGKMTGRNGAAQRISCCVAVVLRGRALLVLFQGRA